MLKKKFSKEVFLIMSCIKIILNQENLPLQCLNRQYDSQNLLVVTRHELLLLRNLAQICSSTDKTFIHILNAYFYNDTLMCLF